MIILAWSVNTNPEHDRNFFHARQLKWKMYDRQHQDAVQN